MAIENDKEFEESLAQLCRFYRAMREIWAQTNVSDRSQVHKPVVAGGRIMTKITMLLADLEVYTGSSEMRLIWDQLKEIRDTRQAGESTERN